MEPDTPAETRGDDPNRGRSRRRFLTTVGGTATIAAISGLTVGAYVGRNVFAPEPQPPTEGQPAGPSPTGNLAGSAVDLPWRENVDISDEFSVEGMYHIPDYSSTSRILPRRNSEFSIYNRGTYRLTGTITYVESHAQHGRELAVEAYPGHQILQNIYGLDDGSEEDTVNEISLEIDTGRTSNPRVEIDVTSDLEGGELWFEGITGSPRVLFGFQ